MAEDKLQQYQRKRRFDRTPEPEGEGESPWPSPIFVVQQHDASRPHYDFRIEVNGVLVSWAVPKGPSTDPRDRRLAVPTEDHPLDYAAFEGAIPAGEYGGGTVMVWDFGLYENLTERNGTTLPMEQALAEGHAIIRLHGKKLQGGYALIRMEGGREERPSWLLIKMQDDEASPGQDVTKVKPDSALTGRSLRQIAAERDDQRRKAA